MQSNATKGLVTGTCTKVLGESTYLYSVTFYDIKGRVIQVQSTNIAGGTDVVTTQYNFTGSPLLSITRHEKPGASEQILTVATYMTYDDLGRLATISKQLNGTVNGQNINTPEQVIVSNRYNAMGELVTKRLHRTNQSFVPVSADPAVGQPGVVYGSEIVSNQYNSAQHTYIAKKRVRLTAGFRPSSGNKFKGRIGYSQQDAEAYNDAMQSAVFFQSVDYRYNIRGWLAAINNADLNSAAPGAPDLFGMELAYHQDIGIGTASPQFNGNISAIKWSTNQGLGTGTTPSELGYKFTYDALNRLTAADHLQRTTAWVASGSFHENNLTYDLNGNIKTLNRKGANASNMDQLAYTYDPSSPNQLQKVDDNGLGGEGFKDGNSIGNDYSYDANGNMYVDKNKSITNIRYNHLNLPDTVEKNTGEYIKYLYDASGRKLSQQVFNASNALQKRTDYIGDVFYENDTLKFVNHEEGRIVMTGVAPDYQYHLKDHLGNARLTFSTQAETTSETASFEAAYINVEQGQFVRYANARRVQSHLVDRTNGAAPSTTPGYAQRLNGGTNEKYGLAKSISVMPGDKIRAEVYAKYVDPQSSNWTAALQALMSQVAGGANGTTVIDGGSYAAATSSFPFATQAVQNTAGRRLLQGAFWVNQYRLCTFLLGKIRKFLEPSKQYHHSNYRQLYHKSKWTGRRSTFLSCRCPDDHLYLRSAYRHHFSHRRQ